LVWVIPPQIAATSQESFRTQKVGHKALENGNISGGKCRTLVKPILADARTLHGSNSMTVEVSFLRCQLRTAKALWVASLCSAVLPAAQARAATADRGKPVDAEAQQLVVAAVQSELAGDSTRFLPLLNAAIQKDPNNQLARWQLGQIQVDGKWVTVEEAQRRVAADPLQTEYRERRSAAGPNAQDQLLLARWCRKNKLNSESELHWATVLSLNPSNEEALRALDMRWKGGRLVSRNESAQDKQLAQAAKDGAKHWETQIARWRRAVGGHEVAAHDAALAEIRAIDRIDAIPSLETVTLGRDANDPDHAEECLQIALAFLEALGKFPDQAATASLVRHAVFSPGNKARALATEKLKPRPQTDFVPILLTGLAMPLESSFDVRRSNDGSVHYTHSLYREGQDNDWSSDIRLSAIQNDIGGRHVTYDVKSKTFEVGPTNGAYPSEILRRDRLSAAYANRFANTLAATEVRVAQANQRTEVLNSLIMRVLSETTGKEMETPKAWWDWWRDQNEYYASDDRAVDQHYTSKTVQYNYGAPSYDVRYPPPPPPPPRPRRSCFAKGTPVWTNAGKKPIETLTLGDFVLAQNVETGELKYKPVLALTVRPPSSMLKISTETDQVTTTLGHPFWVAGVGWKMSKEIGDDAMLHSVGGPARVKATESAADAEAYNLVVADFNTYFVGESGLLVHDNTPRRSARVAIPGIELK
jgi:hypothetical protein